MALTVLYVPCLPDCGSIDRLGYPKPVPAMFVWAVLFGPFCRGAGGEHDAVPAAEAHRLVRAHTAQPVLVAFS